MGKALDALDETCASPESDTDLLVTLTLGAQREDPLLNGAREPLRRRARTRNRCPTDYSLDLTAASSNPAANLVDVEPLVAHREDAALQGPEVFPHGLSLDLGP